MISYILRQIYISIIRCVFGHGSVSKSFNHWFLRYEPVFLGWASCLMLPYSYRWLDCLFNIFSVWHLSKHPSSALQTLYAGNRSTRKWPVTWKLSCIDIIMAGPVKHRVIWNGRFFKMKAILPYGIAIYLEQRPTNSDNGSHFCWYSSDSSLVCVPNFIKPLLFTQ